MTPVPMLFFIIFVQVIIFQFAPIWLPRTISGSLAGFEGIPAEVNDRLESFGRRSQRNQFVLGGILCLVAALAAFVLPLELRDRKLSLAAVSIASTAGMIFGWIRIRRVFARLTADLPEPTLRAAALRRRRLGDYYPLLWEALPAILLAATVGLTIRTSGDLSLWIIPFAQGLILGLMTILGLERARSAGCLPRRAQGGIADPERLLAMDEDLRRFEIRYGLAAKTLIVLVLGLMQVRRVLSVGGEPLPGWLTGIQWIPTLALLILFAAYLRKLALSRKSTDGPPDALAVRSGKRRNNR